MPRIETNGVETYYERTGDGDRPAVVCIHGLGLDHRLWTPQFEDLGEEYDLVAYDYRGHGETGPTARSDYSVELLASDLRELVAGLGLDAPVLLAHSYGGLIAAEYAVQYPDDLAGIVFADARTDVGENTFERVAMRLTPVLDRVEDVVGEDRFQRAMRFVAMRLQDMEEGEDREVPGLGMTTEEYSEDAHEAVDDDEQEKLTRAGRAFVGAAVTDFHVPVLYAFGEKTGSVIADRADRLRRAPTDVRVREVEGASHGLPMERPEPFDEALRSFLADVFDRERAPETEPDP